MSNVITEPCAHCGSVSHSRGGMSLTPYPRVYCYDLSACASRAALTANRFAVLTGVDHAASSGDGCVLSVVGKDAAGRLHVLECVELLDQRNGGDALTARLREMVGDDISARLCMLASVAKEVARQQEVWRHYLSMQNVEFFRDLVVNANKCVGDARKALADHNEAVNSGAVKADPQRMAALANALHHAEGRVSGMESIIRRVLNNPGETIEQIGRLVKDRYLAEYQRLNEVPSSETVAPSPRYSEENMKRG